MEQTFNPLTLRGELNALPQYSHDNHGRKFYRFILNVPRLSGAVDQLPVVAEERILNELDLSGGQMLTVTGQIRSHNIRADGARRLLIFVFANTITAEDGEPMNDVVIRGPLCRDPVSRRTPLGRSICDLMLAVSRRYGRTDYLPVIAWGQLALQAGNLQVGDFLSLEGRIQSRTYHKQTETGTELRTAYEVSVMHLLPEEPQSEELFDPR